MMTLVVASPCALVLDPVSHPGGDRFWARQGVLFRGGVAVESLAG